MYRIKGWTVARRRPNRHVGAHRRKKNFLGILGATIMSIMLTGSLVGFVAPAFAGGDTQTQTINWSGNGSDNADPGCQPGQGSYFHWILTPAQGSTLLSGTLNVGYTSGATTSTSGTFRGNGSGAMHFDVNLSNPVVVKSASVSFTYEGSGGNFVLTLSGSSCTGTPTPPSKTDVQGDVTFTEGSVSCVDHQAVYTNPVYTVAGNEHVVYDTARGTHQADFGQSVDVKATGVDDSSKYNLTGQTEWSHTFGQKPSAPENCEATPPPPTATPGTASATSEGCVQPGSSDGTATITVTNPADETHATETYNVTLNSVVKQVTVADGSDGSVVFSDLAAGDYDWTVTGPDGTDASGTVTVKQCETPQPPDYQAPTVTSQATCATGSDGIVTGMVTSPNDIADTATVDLGTGHTTTVDVPANGSAPYELDGFLPGDYDGTVTLNTADTSTEFSVTVESCEQPPPPVVQGKNMTTVIICGQVKFFNPNDFAAELLYGSFKKALPDGQVTVPANGSVVVKTSRLRLDFEAFASQPVGDVNLNLFFQEGSLSVPQHCGSQPPPKHHGHHGHKGSNTPPPSWAPTTPVSTNMPAAASTGYSSQTVPWLPVGVGASLLLMMAGFGLRRHEQQA